MKLKLWTDVGSVRVSAVATIADGKITKYKFVLEAIKMENPQIAAFKVQVEQNFAAIQAGITSLDQQIQTFMNNATLSNLSTEDLADLQQIQTDSAALASAAAAPVTGVVPPTPAPPPAPNA